MREWQVWLCLVVAVAALAPPRPEFQLTNEVPLPGSSAPAEFQLTEAQVQQCRAPLMPGMEMYLTPVGYSMLGGQWGSWQLTDSPDAPATASWRLNFMSSDWRTVHIKAEGNLSALATPVEIDDLKGYNFALQDGLFGNDRWAFVEDLLAPGVAMRYDAMSLGQLPCKTLDLSEGKSMQCFFEAVSHPLRRLGDSNYSMGQAPDSFPETYTATPRLKDAAVAEPTWQYWAVTDCKNKLVAVVALEETDGLRPGRCRIYNAKGQKAAEGVPDAVMPRLQFVDINQNLLATAEAPALGSNIPMFKVPRRPALGDILPYSIRFERGGYIFSSDLLNKDFRWLLSVAVQLRSLQDAYQGYTPLFVKDKYLLLSVVVAFGLIFIVIFGAMLVSSVRTASRIFFHRDKSLHPDYQTSFP